MSNGKKLKVLQSFVYDSFDENKENTLFKNTDSVKHSRQYIQQLEIEKLKLSEGMDYLRQRIKSTEQDHRKLLEDIIDIKQEKQFQRKTKDEIFQQLNNERDNRKKIQQILNTSNANFCTLQKKYNVLNNQNAVLREKNQKIQQKYTQLVNKRNNHFNCMAKEKNLNEKIMALEREIQITKEKVNQYKSKYQFINHKQEMWSQQNKKLKKVIQEKENYISEINQRFKMLENDSIRQCVENKDMLESLMTMIKNKQKQVQQKQKQLLKFEPIMQKMAIQMQNLIQKNKYLQNQLHPTNIQKHNKQIYMKFKQIEETCKKFEKNLDFKSQNLYKKIIYIKEQYEELENIYDKLVVKYYHNSRTNSGQTSISL